MLRPSRWVAIGLPANPSGVTSVASIVCPGARGTENTTSGSVSFQGKWCKFQTDAYQRLYQAAEIKSRSAATRSTWMTRRRASEMVWLM